MVSAQQQVDLGNMQHGVQNRRKTRRCGRCMNGVEDHTLGHRIGLDASKDGDRQLERSEVTGGRDHLGLRYHLQLNWALRDLHMRFYD